MCIRDRVAAARKDEVQAEKANTQSKLSATESKEAELEEKKNNLLGEDVYKRQTMFIAGWLPDKSSKCTFLTG